MKKNCNNCRWSDKGGHEEPCCKCFEWWYGTPRMWQKQPMKRKGGEKEGEKPRKI